MNFKKIKKRAIAILLSFTMITPYATPTIAMAADDEDSSFDASYFENAASGSNITSSISAGSISSLQSQIGTAIAMQVTSSTSSSSTTLSSIDDISDIEVGLTASPDSYRWTAWYRKNAEDELDTSNSNGNYYGFSLDKVKAWSEYSEEIKNLNNGQFPELQDYTYPTTTADGTLNFWADKPGVYDVYGDPHYSQVVLTAKVDVTYTTETQTAKLMSATDSSAGYPDADATDSMVNSDGVTSFGADNTAQALLNQFCTNIKAGKGSQAQYKQLKKDLKALGFSIKNFKNFSSYKKAVSKCTKSNSNSNNKANLNKISSDDNWKAVANYTKKNGFTTTSGNTQKVYQEIGMLSTDTDSKEQLCSSNAKDKINALSSSKSFANSLCKSSKKSYQAQSSDDLSSHIKDKDSATLDSDTEQVDMNGKVYAIETTHEQTTETFTIAQTVINDVYGSQLERVGTVAVGEKVNTWNMDNDSFWQTTPDYYSQDTDYLTVEAKDSDNAFDVKEIQYDSDGNAIDSGDDDSGSSENLLMFGFSRSADSDVIGGEVTFANLVVKQSNLVHGYNSIPNSNASIDASLDVNNAGSKYQGKIPLVNFSVTSGEATQTSNSSLKKYVILTQDNEEATNKDSAKNEVKDTESSTKTTHSTNTTQKDGKTVITDVTTKVTTIGDKTNTSQDSN